MVVSIHVGDVMAAVRYRLWQLRQLLLAGPLTAEAALQVQAQLSPAEWALFQRFRPADQWHGYRVWQALQAAGPCPAGLVVAALLHDVGKTLVRLTVVDRCLIVLALALKARWSAAYGMVERRLDLSSCAASLPQPFGRRFGWRTPFVVKGCHAAWGAELAQQVGSDPLAVTLIRYHQTPAASLAVPEVSALLSRLQQADDHN